MPDCLEVSAWTDGRRRSWACGTASCPLEGVQFHPESILTTAGKDLLRNFLGLGAKVSIKRPPREAGARRAADRGRGRAAMDAIMDGDATPAQIGALLAAMAARGETEDEVVGFARTMRARARPARARADAVDTCGTGGDGAGTFNISTVASFVVAACGVPVAKHGNRVGRAARCGSADVLEALGVRIDAPTATVQRLLDEVGWTFLFAPALPRRDAPRGRCRARSSACGPSSTCSARSRTRRARRAGGRRAAAGARAVHRALPAAARRAGGRGSCTARGSTSSRSAAPTIVAEVATAQVRTFTVDAEEAGLAPAPLEALARRRRRRQNAAIARAVLAGEPGPRRDVVLLNAAAALVVAGAAEDLREGVRLAAARDRRRPRRSRRVARAARRRMSARAACAVLDAILARTRERVAREKARRPLDRAHRRRRPPRQRARFAAALARPGRVSVIAEIKRRSPSRGAIREDLEPATSPGATRRRARPPSRS